MPLYFDRGVKKTGKSATRYARYSVATTLGQYMGLNPPPHQSKDFRFDFSRGHLRLPSSNALLSIPLGERRRVQAKSCLPPSSPQALEDIASSWALNVVDLGSVLPALATHEPLPEPIRGLEDPWLPDPNAPWSPSLVPPAPTPSGISPDANHDRFLRLASHDTSVAMAHALDSLDGGANSPPPGGRGPH